MYAVQTWPLGKQRHTTFIEAVQRRTEKIVKELYEIAYVDRLSACGLLSLGIRRCADLVEFVGIEN